MNTDRSFLFLMLGFPGSGKSYVSDWLAPYMSAVHLRADDMRMRMFGKERLEHHTNWKYQKQVHGAMQYAAGQVLRAKHSAIYDANHNSVKSRQLMAAIAKEVGAVPVLIWVKAPLELAKQRVLDREAAGGLKAFNLDFVERMAANLERPTAPELFVELDGRQSAEEQRKYFDEQFRAIIDSKVQ